MEDDELIKQYLVREKGYAEMPAEVLFDKVTEYDDIREEFLHWLKERNYEVDEPIEVEGYNALAILDRHPDWDGIGVYNALTDLRDHPVETKKIIDKQ